MRVEIEDLKAKYSMRDIVEERYNLFINRAGFISCPFHNEKTASCKIYDNGFYCFGCGAHGDIFTFVELMEDCSFKEAFKRLGGNLQGKISDAQLLRRERLNKEKQAREKAIQDATEAVDKWELLLNGCNEILNASDVFSDIWCFFQNKKPYYEYRLELAMDDYFDAKKRRH